MKVNKELVESMSLKAEEYQGMKEEIKEKLQNKIVQELIQKIKNCLPAGLSDEEINNRVGMKLDEKETWHVYFDGKLIMTIYPLQHNTHTDEQTGHITLNIEQPVKYYD